MTRASLVCSVCLLAVVAAGACTAAVTDAHGAVAPTPATLDFGTVLSGSAKTLTAQLLNKGTVEVVLARATVGGDARGAFSVVNAPTVVAGGGRVDVAVTYRPPAVDGTDEATLVVAVVGGDEVKVALIGRSSTTCPGGSTETACGNGEDDDCDGKVDCEDPDCTAACAADACLAGTELRVTHDEVDSSGPSLAWNGSEFAMLWMQAPEGGFDYQFARAASASGLLGSVSPATSSHAAAHPPQLAWGAGEFGFAWSDTRTGHNDIYFERLSAAGLLTGTETRLTESDAADFAGTSAWNPVAGEWAAAWSSAPAGAPGPNEIVLRRLDASGAPKAAAVRLVAGTGGADHPFLAWDGQGYGAVWSQVDPTDGIYVVFQRFDAAGAPRGSPRAFGRGKTAYFQRLVWTGSEYGLAWVETAAENKLVRFARVGADGATLGEPRTVATVQGFTRAQLAHGPSGWVVAWEEHPADGVDHLRVQRLAADGSPVGSAPRATCSQQGSQAALAYGNGDFALAWSDTRDGGKAEIYFKLLPRE